MTSDRETAEVIRSWMKEPAELDDAGLHRVLTQVPETRQRRYRWLPPFSTFEWRTATMFGAAKYLVAGVIVAFLGGLLLISLSPDQQPTPIVPAAETTSPEPVGSPQPSLAPAPLPAWPEGYQSSGMSWEPAAEPRTWKVYSEPHGHFPGAQETAVGPDGAPWFWEPGGCGDPMSGGEVMCAWQMGRPGYTAFPPPDSFWLDDLAVAEGGTLWAATHRGLQSFDGEAWTKHSDGSIRSLAVGPDGSVWGFGSGDDSLRMVRFHGGSTTEEPDIPSFPDFDPVEALVPFTTLVTRDGDVWVGGGQMGSWGFVDDTMGFLARYREGTWEPVRLLGQGTHPGVLALAEGPGGSLWALLRDTDGPYLAHLEGGTWTVLSPEDGLPGAADGSLAVAPDGTVWITLDHAEASDGVVAFDGRDWTRYLAGQPVGELVITPAGVVMVGSIAPGEDDANVIAIRHDAEIIELED